MPVGDWLDLAPTNEQEFRDYCVRLLSRLEFRVPKNIFQKAVDDSLQENNTRAQA